jgi:hypothetical protein
MVSGYNTGTHSPKTFHGGCHCWYSIRVPGKQWERKRKWGQDFRSRFLYTSPRFSRQTNKPWYIDKCAFDWGQNSKKPKDKTVVGFQFGWLGGWFYYGKQHQVLRCFSNIYVCYSFYSSRLYNSTWILYNQGCRLNSSGP